MHDDADGSSGQRPPGRTDADSTRLAVIGTGYVGLTTGACLAAIGHEVVCVDIDEAKIARLRRGEIPIVEDGLQELVRSGLADGRLEFVDDPARAVEAADVVFLSVPTPQDDDGSADLTYVEAAARSIAPHLKSGAIVVNKSTVPVGSTRVVEQVIGRDDIVVVSNPEFLREGSAVADFLHPDRVVVGADDRRAAERVAALYGPLETQIVITDPASAETIKYAANGFLAMKISFVNAVAALCEAVDADIADVVRGIGLDRRIGPEFLNPGPGWGGSCFPKDARALVNIAHHHGYDFSMMRGVIEVNDEQRRRMVDKILTGVQRHRSPGALEGLRVAVLGLSFKAGTDDLRDSPALAVIKEIQGFGAEVVAHDPTVEDGLDERRARLLADSTAGPIVLAPTVLAAVEGADIVAIATEWDEYRAIDPTAFATVMRGRSIVDMRNVLDPARVRAAGLDYQGVGRR